MKRGIRALVLAMSLTLCISLLPLAVFAEEGEEETVTQEAVEETVAADTSATENSTESEPALQEPTWSWTLENGKLEISGTGAMTLDGAAPWADRLSEITAVAVGEGITAIADHAFCDCTGLTSVVLPQGLQSIGANSFRGCAVYWVTLPETLVSIGEGAFSGCAKLTRITIPGNVSTLEEGCIDAATQISGQIGSAAEDYAAASGNIFTVEGEHKIRGDVSGNLGDSITWKLDDGVLTISGQGAMEQTDAFLPWEALRPDIRQVVIEEGITSVAENAFACCRKLTQVTLPDSLKTIGKEAFRSCISLKEITLPAAAEIAETAFDADVVINQISENAQQETEPVPEIPAEEAPAQTETVPEEAAAEEPAEAAETTEAAAEETAAAEEPVETPETTEAVTEETAAAEEPSEAAETTEAVTEETAAAEEPAEAAETTEAVTEETAAAEEPSEAAETTEAVTEETAAAEEPSEAAETTEAVTEETAAAEEPSEAAEATEAVTEATTAAEESAEAAEAVPEETAAETEPTAPAATLQLSQSEALAGQKVQVTVSVQGNPGIAALTFRLGYDAEAIRLVDYSAVDNDSWTLSLGEGDTALWLPAQTSTKDGQVLTLTFEVLDTVKDGSYVIALEEASAAAEDASLLTMETIPGSIEVRQGIPGDANGDGKVTSADLTRLSNYLVGIGSADAASCDLNGDGKVDLLDALLLNRYLLGLIDSLN